MKTLHLLIMTGFLLTVTFVFHQAYAEQIFSKRNWDKDLTADDCALRKDLVDKHFEPDTNQANLFAQNDPLFKSTVGTQNYSLDDMGPYEMKSYPNCNEDLPIFDLRYIVNNTKTSHDILFVKFDPITYNVIEIMSMQVDGRWQAPVKQQPVSYNVTKWNTVNVLGEFTNSKPPKPPQLFNFLYAIVNGTLENITSNQEGSIVAKVTSKSGVFGIKIPRNYPTSDGANGIGDIMVFDKNGDQVTTHTTAKDCFYETWVSFSGDTQIQVLFRLSYLIQGAAFHGDTVPSYCLDQTITDFHNGTLVNPLPQFRTGTDFDEINCKQGYALVAKLEDGNPACVQSSTLSKLVSRGWASSSIDRLVVRGFDDVYKIGNKIDPTIIFHGFRNECDVPHVLVQDSSQDIIWQSTNKTCISSNASYASQTYHLDSKLGGPLIIHKMGSYNMTISYRNMTEQKEFMVIPYLR